MRKMKKMAALLKELSFCKNVFEYDIVKIKQV